MLTSFSVVITMRDMPTPRERAREQTLADITRLGREQLATVGAAGRVAAR